MYKLGVVGCLWQTGLISAASVKNITMTELLQNLLILATQEPDWLSCKYE
jgi:hypothetical protein